MNSLCSVTVFPISGKKAEILLNEKILSPAQKRLLQVLSTARSILTVLDTILQIVGISVESVPLPLSTIISVCDLAEVIISTLAWVSLKAQRNNKQAET